MRQKIITLAILLLVPMPASRANEIKFDNIFSDHMLFQREQPVPMWGWANAVEEITAEVAGQKKSATADAGAQS